MSNGGRLSGGQCDVYRYDCPNGGKVDSFLGSDVCVNANCPSGESVASVWCEKERINDYNDNYFNNYDGYGKNDYDKNKPCPIQSSHRDGTRCIIYENEIGYEFGGINDPSYIINRFKSRYDITLTYDSSRKVYYYNTCPNGGMYHNGECINVKCEVTCRKMTCSDNGVLQSGGTTCCKSDH